MKNKTQSILLVLLGFLIGLVLITILEPKTFANWKELKFLILLFVFAMWLIIQLVTGQTTLGRGGVASREDNPGFYWLAVFIWSIPVILLIRKLNFKEIIGYQSEILIGIAFILVVCVISTAYLIRKYLKERRLTKRSIRL